MSLVRTIVELFTLGGLQFAIVRQGEVRIIENRGKFKKIAQPGPLLLFSLWGFGDTIGKFTISQLLRNDRGLIQLIPRRNVEVISTRMQVDDYPKESVITRDNATIFIDAVIYTFLPWWTTVLLRLLQRRSWLHRTGHTTQS